MPNGHKSRAQNQFCTKLSTGRAQTCGQGIRKAIGHNAAQSYNTTISGRKRILLSIIAAAGWPIWPLIACSILALALIIERALQLRDERVLPPALVQQTIDLTRKGFPTVDAIQKIGQSSPLGQVLASALQCLHEEPRASEERIRERMELQGRQTTMQLERFLPALATIASVAPLLGLLGTVVGMIEIFGADQAIGGNQPVQLAHGISIALYNTAFGLIVAIPSLMAWRYFRATVDRQILSLESSSERFVRHLRQLRG